ncbi:MAG: hypothetical protein EBR82_41460 [Caulobacteraceae bacterium]|nr:hypothetical protein [Caulobacteraceae bacterium]
MRHPPAVAVVLVGQAPRQLQTRVVQAAAQSVRQLLRCVGRVQSRVQLFVLLCNLPANQWFMVRHMAVAERAELTLLLVTVRTAGAAVEAQTAVALRQVGMAGLRVAVGQLVTQPALPLLLATVDRLQEAVQH